MDPFWKCLECGNTIRSPSPPEICPSCKRNCAFKDVSCYTPDCGGPGNIDPQLWLAWEISASVVEKGSILFSLSTVSLYIVKALADYITQIGECPIKLVDRFVDRVFASWRKLMVIRVETRYGPHLACQHILLMLHSVWGISLWLMKIAWRCWCTDGKCQQVSTVGKLHITKLITNIVSSTLRIPSQVWGCIPILLRSHMQPLTQHCHPG